MLAAVIPVALIIFATGLTAIICCVVGGKAEQNLVVTENRKDVGRVVERYWRRADLDSSYTLDLREHARNS